MPRRLASVLIGVIVLATCAYMLYAHRAGQRGDELLTTAEEASNRGDYASAVRSFEQLTTEYPNHSEVDEALYRLGFTNRHFLNDPDAALNAYERLVRVHGNTDSQWIMLAMREIGDIRRSQQQHKPALEQYESIIAQFGADDPAVHADTALAIARTWFEMGEAAQVKAACQEVLALEPGSAGALDRQRVNAHELMAKSYLDLEGKPKEAVECYQIISEKYRTWPAATDAERELAYIRSMHPDLAPAAELPGPAEEATPAIDPPIPAKVVTVDLPRKPVSGATDTGLYDCMAVLCEAAGHVVGPTKLAGFSSQPFAFFYDSGRLLSGPNVSLHDPVLTSATRAGLPATERIDSPSLDLALTNLKSQLGAGNAVLVPLALDDGPAWRIVRGYDPAQGEFLLYSSFGRHQIVGSEEFRKAWQSPVTPAITWPSSPGSSAVMYVLTGPTRECDVTAAVKSSVADAVRLTRGEVKVGAQESGATAFETLAEDLAGLADGSLRDSDAKQLSDWCGRPLRIYAGRREEAADYLEIWREVVFQPGEEREHVANAIELLRDSSRLLDQLGKAYGRAREGTGPVEGGGSPQDIARSLAELDRQLGDELAAAL